MESERDGDDDGGREGEREIEAVVVYITSPG